MDIFWGGVDDNEIARKVLSYIPDDFSGKLLDVPVGTGVFTAAKYAVMDGAEITCLDYSVDMLDQARERFRKEEIRDAVSDDLVVGDHALDAGHRLQTGLQFSHGPVVEAAVHDHDVLGGDIEKDYSIVANNTGLFYEARSNCASAGAGAVASRGGIKKLGNFVKNGRNWNEFSVDEIASKTAEYATELFGAQKIESGKIPVILSERISARFLGMYSQPFFAETMQKGQSRLDGKEGEKIASDVFSLWNDPTGEMFEHKFYFDSEGCLTKRVKVVENGVFNSALYNLETAAKAGRETTGNGARSFGSKMSTSFYNMLVPPGSMTTMELLKLFPKCLLVVRLEGNSGCNSVSGELSIGAHGFWCENGVIKHPVDGVTLSGNFFDIIKNIVAVGNEYRDPFASYKVPALAVSELSVSA